MERHEFGAAVRQLRERTTPASVGLPAGRRRVNGLRREELGELAGMSADYVRRLEQGRSHPSAGVVNAIARALRIGRADYERLCALAGYAAADGQVPNEVGPGAMRLLERFSDTQAGPVTLVGSLLAIPGDDLAALMLTAAPGSADAARLAEIVGEAGEPAIIGNLRGNPRIQPWRGNGFPAEQDRESRFAATADPASHPWGAGEQMC